MALTATPATLSFTSPLANPQVVTLAGGVAPYTGVSLNTAIATISETSSPNLYPYSDTLASSTATNGTVTGGVFTSSSPSGTLALTEAVTPGTPYTFSGAANATGLLPGIAGATWNPSDAATGITLSNSNLTATRNSTGAPNNSAVRAQGGVSSGRWYWEVTIGTIGSTGFTLGVANASASLSNFIGSDANGWGWQVESAVKYYAGAGTSYGSTCAAGDVIGVALDLGAGTITFYKNGVSQGAAFTGLTGTLYPAQALYVSGDAITVNFGSTAFAYAPPSGFSGYASVPLLTVRDVAGNLITSATVSGTGRFACTPWTPPTNFMPFSDSMAGDSWSPSGWTYGTGGPGGAVDLEYTVPATMVGAGIFTGLMDVTPGQTITMSVWCNPSVCSSGGFSLFIFDYTGDIIGSANINVTTGATDGRYSITWLIPSGVTRIIGIIEIAPSVCTIPSGSVVKWSQSMFEATSAASGYYISSQTPQAVFSYEQNGVSGTGYFDQPMLRTDGISAPYTSWESATFTVTPVSAGTTSLTLTDSTSGTPLQVNVPVTITIPTISFVAATNAGDGGDPVPAGVFTSLATSGGTVVASGYLGIGGGIAAVLTPGVPYTATFTGWRAPPSVTFAAVAASQAITVGPYASAAHTSAGYAIDQTSKYPRGWAADSALALGGGIYPIAAAAASELVDLNNQNQGAILNARLQSSSGQDIALWAADYFGSALSPFAEESSSAYIARIIAYLSAKAGTREGTQTIGAFYGGVIIDEPWRSCETGAFDTNGTLAFDTVGGYGSQDPAAAVYIQPPSPFTQPQGAQAKAAVLASRPLGLSTSVFQVTKSGATLTATPL